MRQYLDLVQNILECGAWQDNRTGIRSLSLPGASLRFDLQQGFPAVTTKKLAFKSAVGEMIGFLRGYTSAADFRALGCKVWDQNANENQAWVDSPWRLGVDDLGPVYGAQWRAWPAYKLLPAVAAKRIAEARNNGYQLVGQIQQDGQAMLLLYKAIDQLRACLDTIMHNPSSRRILFHGWNCAQLEEMALPPCHLLYQFLANPNTRELSLCLYVRSNDVGLGTPFNLTEAGALTHLVARLTGYKPRWLSYFIGDAHIYETHIDMLRAQLQRSPYPQPQLQLDARVPAYADTGVYEPQWLEQVEPGDFALQGYQHHAALRAPMAV